LEGRLAVHELGEIVREMGPLLSRLIGPNVTLELDVASESLPVLADRAQLEQVVLNLAVNGRDAMPEGGLLRISAKAEGKNTFLEVQDHGVGMSEELISQVFAPFFTTKESGTGIGLATVQEIVKRFSGEVQVRSEVNVGSVFTIRLPSSEERPHVVYRPKLLGRERASSGRVLLAEDHELVRRTTKMILEEAGYEVTVVVDGAEALALLENARSFDAMVLDVAMPKVGGLEVIERLDAAGTTLPTVLVSGHLQGHAADRWQRRTRTVFLEKPFSAEILLGAVAVARASLEEPGSSPAGSHA
jgi:CheY-like chemotaxis protein